MLDGTVDPKDTSGANQDSSDGGQGTSGAKTYTEAEVLKIKSDALSKAGRDAQSTDARETALKAREDAQALRDREKDEEDYEKARGNPEALSALQKEKAAKLSSKTIKDERDALEREKVTLQVERDATNAVKRDIGIIELAEKYKVDTTVLKDLDLDLEHTEKVAQRLTTLSPEQLGVKQAPVPKKRDSGVTIGSGGNLTGLTPKETLKEIDRQLRPM